MAFFLPFGLLLWENETTTPRRPRRQSARFHRGPEQERRAVDERRPKSGPRGGAESEEGTPKTLDFLVFEPCGGRKGPQSDQAKNGHFEPPTGLCTRAPFSPSTAPRPPSLCLVFPTCPETTRAAPSRVYGVSNVPRQILFFSKTIFRHYSAMSKDWHAGTPARAAGQRRTPRRPARSDDAVPATPGATWPDY